MLRMTEQDMREYVKERMKSMEFESCKGLEFLCVNSGGKWILTLVVDEITSIRMKSQREDNRKFGTLEAAYKSAKSIINSMTVVGGM